MDEKFDVGCEEEDEVEAVYLGRVVVLAMAESSHRYDKGSSYIIYCRQRLGTLVNGARTERWSGWVE